VASARVKEVLVSMVSGESIDMEVTTKVEEAEESMETEPHAPAPQVNPAKAGESVASAAEKNTEPHAPQFSLGKTGVYWDVEDSPKKTGVNQAGIARVQEVEGRLERTDVNQEVEGYAGRTEVSRPCSGADTTGIPYAESEWQGADEAWWQQQAKSVKADDAANPTHLWDSRVWKLHHHEGLKRHHTQRFGLCPLESLWTWLIGRWRKNLLRSFMLYLLTCYGSERREATPNNLQLRRDLEAGRECLWRASEADWWDWRMGSRLFFWRWPADHHQAARGGYKPYFDGPSPRFLKPQPHEANKQTRKQVRAKLETVRARKYIAKGKVMSLTSYFSVPKGESDVRMVYDATRSNLNASLWAPNFGLPTVDSLLRGVNEGTWMGDLDIGEMFLNFCLHPKLQPLCGVDLRPYFAEEIPGKGTLWERWVRCMMGMKNSPYVCIKGSLLALELIQGDHWDASNPFYWNAVKLNLPGDPCYDPRKSRIEKVVKATGKLAAMIVSYVDDMRATGATSEECWRIMHEVASKASYLGIQVAARKTRPPAKRPGPWSGSMVITDANGIAVKAMQDKWDKMKEQVHQLLQLVDAGQDLDRKTLESVCGSLVYLQRTYPAITPYVKGFHLSIDAWRPDRDTDGWRVSRTPSPAIPLFPPAKVQLVPRLRADLLALTELFSPSAPPL
jgi:hypothetical protein